MNSPQFKHGRRRRDRRVEAFSFRKLWRRFVYFHYTFHCFAFPTIFLTEVTHDRKETKFSEQIVLGAWIRLPKLHSKAPNLTSPPPWNWSARFASARRYFMRKRSGSPMPNCERLAFSTFLCIKARKTDGLLWCFSPKYFVQILKFIIIIPRSSLPFLVA